MDGKEAAGYLLAFLSGGGIGTLLTYVTQTRAYNLEREKWEHERSSHEREDRVRLVVDAWAAMEKADTALMALKADKAAQWIEQAAQLARRVLSVLGAENPAGRALAQFVEQEVIALRKLREEQVLDDSTKYDEKLQRARDAYLPALESARAWPTPK